MCDYTFLQQTEGSKWWDRPPQQYTDDVYWEWAGLATGEWRRARQCLLGVGESAEAGQYVVLATGEGYIYRPG